MSRSEVIFAILLVIACLVCVYYTQYFLYVVKDMTLAFLCGLGSLATGIPAIVIISKE